MCVWEACRLRRLKSGQVRDTNNESDRGQDSSLRRIGETGKRRRGWLVQICHCMWLEWSHCYQTQLVRPDVLAAGEMWGICCEGGARLLNVEGLGQGVQFDWHVKGEAYRHHPLCTDAEILSWGIFCSESCPVYLAERCETLLSARRLFTVNDVCALVQLQPSAVIRHSPGPHTIQSVSWSDESVRLDVFDRAGCYVFQDAMQVMLSYYLYRQATPSINSKSPTSLID